MKIVIGNLSENNFGFPDEVLRKLLPENKYIEFLEADCLHLQLAVLKELFVTLNEFIATILRDLPLFEINPRFHATYDFVFIDKSWKIPYIGGPGTLLAALHALYKSIENCIEHNLPLFVFNGYMIEQFASASVLAVLRINWRMTLVELTETINKLQLETSDVQLSGDELNETIAHLVRIGMIVFAPDSSIVLTPKGYMYVW